MRRLNRMRVFQIGVGNFADVSSCSGFDYCHYGPRRKVLATLRYRW
jgi:hypothetical protein